MKIDREAYKKPVVVPKVWEQIVYRGEKERVLVTRPVSMYIRSLERQIKKLKP